MKQAYDSQNIFAKIIKGTLPAKIIAQNENALAFYDVAPQAAIHALIIPKGAYQNFSEFNRKASQEEKNDFWNLIEETAHTLEESAKIEGKLSDGFRLLANQGTVAGQEVAHFHMHLLGGEKLGPLHVRSSEKA